MSGDHVHILGRGPVLANAVRRVWKKTGSNVVPCLAFCYLLTTGRATLVSGERAV